MSHTAGAHRNQWQSLHGKEGDPGDAGAEVGGWRASCLRHVGTPWRTPRESRRRRSPAPPEEPAKAAAVSTPGRTSSSGMRLPCGWPPGLSPTDRACGCRSRIRQNQRPVARCFVPCWTADGIRASIRRRGRKRGVHISVPVPVTVLPKTALLEFSPGVMAPHI